MDLRIFPRLIEGEEPAPDDVYRLALNGIYLDDLTKGTEWHDGELIAAAIRIEAGASGTPREKFEYYRAHPEKLPPGVILRTRPDIGPRPDREYPR